MNKKLLFFELKSGFSDNGPAWIGYCKFSKSKKTIYFNEKAFLKISGILGNYLDLETNEEYWISGISKNRPDRYKGKKGKMYIEKSSIHEFLKIKGLESLPKDYTVIEIQNNDDIISRIENLQNKNLEK